MDKDIATPTSLPLPTRMMTFMGVKHTILLLLLQHIASANEASLLGRHRRALILQEKSALLTFKSTLTLQSQSLLYNWNESTDVCNFTGVSCNRRRLHVAHLNLSRRLLAGKLSPALANLTGLIELDLSENLLTGDIPPEFSNLRRLLILELSGNKLHGQIPESLATIGSLGYLNLGNNYLVGKIPASIFRNCTQLGAIDLSDNSLSGEIPNEVGIYLPVLLVLNLYLNNLSGRLPLWLSNSSFLDQLDVENNHLSGELPGDFISNMNYLEYLHLSYNYFTSSDGNTNLEPFFVALSNCSVLRELEMAGLGVGGRLPRRVGHVTKSLSIVNLEENMISGPIPPDIGNLVNITLLNLSSNLLNGSVPAEIARFPILERLILSNNFLSGAIPTEIGNISSMGLLDLSSNRLSGEIPVSIGNLSRVSEIYLQRNQLSGEIPASLGGCMSLNKLDLSYNRLTGRIPEEVSGIAKIYFNLSHNQLQGPLPIGLSMMDQVQEIDLSSNNLSGGVISQLSACVELKLINFSHNSLQGRLPESLGYLENLEVLDVSYNYLSGEIPLSLNKCTSLTLLNLSYNDFSGKIPVGGVFSSFSNLSYVGNPHLCWLLTCHTHQRRLHSRKFLVIVCASASVIAFLLTVCCVIGGRKIRERIITIRGDIFGGSSPVMKSNYPRITYRELIEATEEFSEERLIGAGSYGRVYKGMLRDGTVVAVKVLQLQTGNSTKSFSRECQVLKRIRHRNLMKIITACSLPDFKALVLPFMANGSLESCLYSGNHELSLIQRVNICSDIAEGMAYLHHHSPVKVIHCDLKPSNVLLNDDMTALVSDFGISRLVANVGGGNTITLDNVGASTANLLCGSIGYIAPEYGYGSNASTKGDVYSFGVVVLETVTKKRPTDEMFEGGLSLHKWVKSHYNGRVDVVIDSGLASMLRDQTPEVKRMSEAAISELLELGLLCTQESPSTRPTMMDAADDLDRLKRYLSGDTTATFASSLGMSSSTIGE
ncbi:uncharacterized protein [Typha latifolia]|uniref:uncharacterized protein n=1 Tax=Typha latifolia TaxID=4733 RepID=UPI003C2CD705